MARLEFDIPDYTRGLTLGMALGPGEGLRKRISLALAGAHARAVEAEARRRAPMRTGRLRDSIRAFLAGAGRGVLVADAPYAKYLHEGTGIYGPARQPIFIEPRGKRALHWPGAAHPVRVVRQEGIRPRDFLRHAVRMYFPALRAFAAGLSAASNQPSNVDGTRGRECRGWWYTMLHPIEFYQRADELRRWGHDVFREDSFQSHWAFQIDDLTANELGIRDAMLKEGKCAI